MAQGLIPNLNPRTKEIIDPGHPLLEANRAAIEAIERRTHPFGSSGLQLDIYYPPPPESSEVQSKSPIFVFFYGGGLTRGMRSHPPSMLVHNNLGAFFASRGILTVIPDYRLVPSVVFPEASQDVHDALTWVIEHLTDGDPIQLFVLGHSAGAVHVAGLFLMSSMLSAAVTRAVRGIALLGVPYEILNKRKPDFRAAAEKYYGSAKKIAMNQPSALLRRADPAYIATLPPILNLTARSEPRVISSAMRVFAKEVKEKGGAIEEYVLDGHDHSSPILALGSGSGEEWGKYVAEWILAG